MTNKSIVVSLDGEAFLLTHQTDHEIRIKHRASGHVVCFPLSEDGVTVEEPHRIDLDPSSAYNGRRLIQSARRAAHRYLGVAASLTGNSQERHQRPNHAARPFPICPPSIESACSVGADIGPPTV
jgi:hypothetical protein